ncbi:MAG: MFS transporter, partial [Mycetocola sp.]
MIGPTHRRSIPAWLRPAPAVFMLAWGGNHFTPLLHLYEELGHYDTGEANLLLGMYVVGLIPGLLLASALSDKYGRKPILLIGIGFAILGSILLACGLDTFWLLCAGRTLAGVGVGVAMSVGTSWMKELSSVPFDLRAGRTAGARRPALTLTLGFGIGAAVTGALGQWGYAPTTTPYVLHVMLTLLALLAVLWTPESLGAEHRTTESWWRDLRVPAAGHRRFVRLVIPSAPWVFASAGIAYAVVPALVQDHLGRWTTLYATALAVLALGCGAVVQSFVPWINRHTGGNA